METEATGKDRSGRPEGGSLRRTLGLWFCLIALFSCVLVGSLTYYLRAQGCRDLVFDHVEDACQDKIRVIDSWLTERRANMELWRARNTFRTICLARQKGQDVNTEQNRASLDQLAAEKGYSEVFVADPGTGLAVVSSAPERLDSCRLAEPLLKQVVQQRRTIMSDVHRNEVTGRPELVQAGPILSRTGGEVIGVLVFHIDLQSNFYSVFLRADGLGRTGEVFLVNRDGLAQSPLKTDEDAVGKTILQDELAVRAAEGSTGRIIARDYRSADVIAAVGQIPEMGLGIVVKQDMTEVNAPIRRMACQVAGVSFGVLVLAAMVGLFVAAKVMRPAARIAEVAEKIGAGELETRADESGPSEIRKVAASLNRMVERLVEEISLGNTLNARLQQEIVDRHHGEQRERELLAELAHTARLSTMAEMASGLAHELNQPLTAISTLAYVIAQIVRSDQQPDNRKLAEMCGDVGNQALRAGRLVHRMREFVKKIEPSRVTLDLREVIDEVLGLMGNDFRLAKISVQVNLDEPLPATQADRIQVEQVLLNLMRNGLEAMQHAESEPHLLTLEAKAREGYLEIAVGDTGPGIPDGSAHELFDTFYTTKPEGMGMGLAICRTIVEAHGGRIRAQPNTDRGATFTFTLPILGEDEVSPACPRLSADHVSPPVERVSAGSRR